MKLVHLELKEANAFIETHHRHHKPVVGHRFSIGAEKSGVLVGCAIIGRPVAREIDWRKVVEVTRLCTDGTKNACSFLYAAAARAAKALGYEKIQTYILEEEPGVSLTASGWEFEAETTGKHSWNNRDGRRKDQPTCKKHRYGKVF
jgi:hypothetical protein